MESDKDEKLVQAPCPQEKSSFLSYLFFWWVYPTLFKGSKKELQIEDLYQPLKSHRSEYLGDKLCNEWEKELEKLKKSGKEPSMMKALLRVFGLEFAILGVIIFVVVMLFQTTQPIFLGYLIKYYETEGNADADQPLAMIYAAAMLLCSVFNVLFYHPWSFANLHLGMKLRLASCNMMYKKSLKLTTMTLGNTTIGQIVNLMSNDMQRLEQSILFPHYLWISPIQLIVVTVLLYIQIGPSTFVGIVFMLLFIPLQFMMGKKLAVWRLQTARRTDERVRMMNEIIQGIQVIKMYVWEKPFGKMINLARKSEIKMIRYVSYIRGLIFSFILFITRTSIFLSLVTFVLLSNILDAQKAFMVTAYFNVLRQNMTGMFPLGLANMAEFMVSMGRIQKFMLNEEYESIETQMKKKFIDMDQAALVDSKKIENGGVKGQNGISETVKEVGVTLRNVTAKWDPEMVEKTLLNVNLSMKPGKLIAIIGPVGAGKSSIFQTILGELRTETGFVEVNGKLSYACQEPWLFSSSIQQNILFGLPMDTERYRNTVKICALERDFTLFPFGDKTIVGERGQSLSGGQKARVNLARAIYREADIYLLDDPLSAVDSHVGRHLFDKCIRRHLYSKAVLLITHQLQYLQEVDEIVYINHGRIEAVGTYESLIQSGLDFTKLLAEQEIEDKKRQAEELKIKRSSARSSGRKISTLSGESDDQTVEEIPNQMKVAETKQVGNIGWSVYMKYFNAGGGIWGFIFVFCFLLLSQVFGSVGDFYLNYWVGKQQVIDTDAFYTRMKAFIEYITEPMFRDGWWDDFTNDPNFDIYVFTVITILTIVFTLSRSFIFFNFAMKASQKLHDNMFKGVSQASMYFFNTNPSGRILNRFSKDLGSADEGLPATMIDVMQTSLSLIGIIAVLATVNPWYLIATAIIFVIFYFLRKFYLKTSLDVKRLESMNRSPIYAHLSITLDGLSTIRAFKAEEALIREFNGFQDVHSSAYYMFLATVRLFGHWLDLWCVLYIIIITGAFFVLPGGTGGDIGLAITQALGMTGFVQYGMRQSAELENNMTSVERIMEYNTVDPEPSHDSSPDIKPPESWPENGKVIFNNLFMRYFPDPEAENVLRGLNFVVQPREKIGIVGRTGAGKSSLINALFRLSYNEGLIEIDGRDTQPLGLHDLRSKISIIPQEPVLFSGTLRYNLDPFDEFSDDKLWKALEEVKLKEVASEMPAGLQSRISEGGSNFSVGQRQLVCLARAILRENKILLMDEATANVDAQTDSLIQETIRTKFADCTVLTIAHRLNTVMDSDKVLVMDAGQCVEFAPPYELLTKESEPRVFHGMVMKTGKTNYEMMLKIAEKAYRMDQLHEGAHELDLKEVAERTHKIDYLVEGANELEFEDNLSFTTKL